MQAQIQINIPDIRRFKKKMENRRHAVYLSPVVGVSHVDEGEILGQEVLFVDDVHEEAGVQPVFGHDELLEVVDGDRAGALEEPPVRVVVGTAIVLVRGWRGHPVPVNVVGGFAAQVKK